MPVITINEEGFSLLIVIVKALDDGPGPGFLSTVRVSITVKVQALRFGRVLDYRVTPETRPEGA